MKEKNASLTTNKNGSDEFTYRDKQYRLVVAAESKGGTTIKIVEKATENPVEKPLKATDFFATDPDARQKFNDLFNAANNLRNGAKKPTAGQPKPKIGDLRVLQADVNAKRTVLINEMVTDHSCESLSGGCFGAGTMLAVEGGYQAIEDIRAGERVMSRDQWNEGGAISAKIVEEVFERYAGVLTVRAAITFLPGGDDATGCESDEEPKLTVVDEADFLTGLGVPERHLDDPEGWDGWSPTAVRTGFAQLARTAGWTLERFLTSARRFATDDVTDAARAVSEWREKLATAVKRTPRPGTVAPLPSRPARRWRRSSGTNRTSPANSPARWTCWNGPRRTGVRGEPGRHRTAGRGFHGIPHYGVETPRIPFISRNVSGCPHEGRMRRIP